MSYLTDHYDGIPGNGVDGYQPKRKKSLLERVIGISPRKKQYIEIESVRTMTHRIAVSVLGEDAAPEKLELMERLAFAVADRTDAIVDLADPSGSVMQLGGWTLARYALGHEDILREILAEIGASPDEIEAKLSEKPEVPTPEGVDIWDREDRGYDVGITDHIPTWRELWAAYALEEDADPDCIRLDPEWEIRGREYGLRVAVARDIGIELKIDEDMRNPTWDELMAAYRERGDALELTEYEKKAVNALEEFRNPKEKKIKENQALRDIIRAKNKQNRVFPKRRG